ncbi:MAG TPA: thioredoxin family protein [Planctomycetota bacterium]|nr:thioredoxin family protein [Planctomycetota bacterium]
MRSKTIMVALCWACLTSITLPAADDANQAPPKPAQAGDKAAADATEPVWLTSLEKAQELAKKEHKKILTNFTGSDWCIWCKKLEAEVFSTATFKTWAAKNVILLKLDFPKQKPQDDATKTANRALMNKYGVKGFPTVLFLDETGKEVGRSGYQEGGADKWTSSAEKAMAGTPAAQ